MWVVDTIMAFPLFVLAMGIVAALGSSVENIIYATAIVNVPFYARTVRAEINQRREAGFVEAARVSGNGSLRVLAYHLFPTTVPQLAVQMTLTMGWAMLNAAALSYIGLGIRPPTPEWGIMVAEGASFIITGEWWVALFPGLALVLVVLSLNLLGDGLRDMIDAAGAALSVLVVDKLLDPFPHAARHRAGAGPRQSRRSSPARSSGWSAKADRANPCSPMRSAGCSIPARAVVGGEIRWHGTPIGPVRERRTTRAAVVQIFQNPRASLNPIRAIGRQLSDVAGKDRVTALLRERASRCKQGAQLPVRAFGRPMPACRHRPRAWPASLNCSSRTSRPPASTSRPRLPS